MKSILGFALTTLFILVGNVKPAENLQIETYLNDDNRHYSQTNQISHQQTKAQVEFFREALDELGATSPEQVLKIWVKAEDTRNGVFHYAVACDELKSKIIKEWGEPKDSFWIYRGSSPWLSNYEIVYMKKLNDSEYEAKIKFFWITSLGSAGTTETTLLIVKDNDIWCVKEAK